MKKAWQVCENHQFWSLVSQLLSWHSFSDPVADGPVIEGQDTQFSPWDDDRGGLVQTIQRLEQVFPLGKYDLFPLFNMGLKTSLST